MELWDAYNEKGDRVPGTLVRGEPVPEGLYHLVCCVLVRHVDGSFLLMRRSPEKESYPNIWEIGAGGSALQGETALEAAKRELREETGIDRGTFLPISRSWDHKERFFYEGFLCETDYPKNQIRLQAGETCDFRWLSLPGFLTFFDSDDCLERMRSRLAAFVDTLRPKG